MNSIPPVINENPTISNETLELEVKELKEKLSSIEQKMDSLTRLLTVLTEGRQKQQEESAGSTKEVSAMQRNLLQFPESFRNQKEVSAVQGKLMQSGESLGNGKEVSAAGRNLMHREESFSNTKEVSAMGRKSTQPEESQNAGKEVSAAGRKLLQGEESLYSGKEVYAEQRKPPLQEDMIDDIPADSAKENNLQDAAGNDMLEFTAKWSRMTREQRSRKENQQLFIEFAKTNPSFILPHTNATRKLISKYGIETVELSSRLYELIHTKLKKNYASFIYTINAARILIMLNQDKSSEGIVFRNKTGIPESTFFKTINILRRLGLVQSLFGGKYHRYFITKEGIEFLSAAK